MDEKLNLVLWFKLRRKMVLLLIKKKMLSIAASDFMKIISKNKTLINEG